MKLLKEYKYQETLKKTTTQKTIKYKQTRIEFCNTRAGIFEPKFKCKVYINI